MENTGKLIDATPDNVAHWRNSLNMSDLGASAKELYLMLHHIHSVKLEPLIRFEIMEILRPTVSFIATHLLEKISENSILNASTKNKILLLIQTLKLESAEGYKIIIDHCVNSKIEKKVILISTYRLMNIQYKVLSTAFQHYSPPPKGLWLEMHQLYQFSEHHRLTTKLISQENISQIRHKTILDVYKHSLLMSIANPFRLSHTEVQQLNYLLEDCLHYLNLKAITKPNNEFLIVNLNQDSGPIYKDHATKAEFQGKIIALEIGDLIKYMEKLIYIKKTEKQDTEKSKLSVLESIINITLLEKLYVTWTQCPIRSKDRIEAKSKVRVTIGLSATHYFIEKNIPEQTGETSDNIQVNTYDCQVVNQSPEGFCLEWPENRPQIINTLELIGINFKNENQEKDRWLIGSVQWLKQVNGKLHVGVKIISTVAKPIKIQLYSTEDGALSKFMSALLLPENIHLKQPQTLIVPSLPFKENSKINLVIDQNEIIGNLKTTVLKAHHYKQFTINYEDKAPVFDIVEPIKNKGFNSLNLPD